MLRVIALAAALLLPLKAQAQGLVICGARVGENNAITNRCTLQHAFILGANIINLAIMLAGSVAIVMIMIGGYKMLTSGLSGSPEGYDAGKQSIINALGGLLLILLSYVLVNAVMTLLFPETFGSDFNWTRPWQ